MSTLAPISASVPKPTSASTSKPPPSNTILIKATPLIVPDVIPVLSVVVIVIVSLRATLSAPAELVTAVITGAPPPPIVTGKHLVLLME